MIIGLEGVSCVGKSTLAAALATRLNAHVVPCYYHAAPDPSWRPRLHADTADAQLDNVRVLMRVEQLRRRQTDAATATGRHVVLDRTVDTVLAHAHAVGRLAGFDVDAAARDLVLAGPIAVPDVTLLLEATPGDLTARAATRVDMPSLLYHPAFTAVFHDFFTTGRPITPSWCRLDATRPATDVVAQASAIVDVLTKAAV